MWRNGSRQRRTAPRFKIAVGPLTSRVQLSRSDVGFDLLVPSIGQKFLELLRKGLQVLAAEVRDAGFEFLDGHTAS